MEKQFWILEWLEGYFKDHSTHGPWDTRKAAVEWANEILSPAASWKVIQTEGIEQDD